MIKRWMLVLLLAVSPLAQAADDEPLKRVFGAQELDATMVIRSVDSGQSWVWNETRAQQRLSPASTFKVFNTLIALQSGAISDRDEVFVWDGTRHDIAEWNRDQTLASAFRVSCVWCYQELARRVGKEPYRRYLGDARYGVLAEPFDLTAFWLDGGLQVSAYDQVDLLRRIHLHELPFDPRNYAILKNIMVVERTPAYTLYAKTGWAARTTPQTGWYVGIVEKAGGTWVFALNLTLRSAADLPLRARLAREALAAVGVIPQAGAGH